MRYIFFITTLLAVVLFQGCSNRDESNDTNTTQTIDPSAQTLELDIETNELPENNETTVMVTTADGQEVTSAKNIIWHISDANVTEINGTKLIGKSEGTATIRAQVGREYSQERNVTVYKIINGHRLPPEPDPAINSSTLLGIDSNNNGVRDDVERYIYNRYSEDTDFPKTKIALAMQYAWATQIIIDNKKYLDDAADCQFYWLDKITKHLPTLEAIKYAQEHIVFNDSLINDAVFNTKERVQQNYKFNEACSGHIFPGRKKSIDNCQTNIDELGE